MIPREILKQIPHIEIRTNRLVTEALAGQSISPLKDTNPGEVTVT